MSYSIIILDKETQEQDAQNMNSVHLSEKLGYEYAHDYVAYEVIAG